MKIQWASLIVLFVSTQWMEAGVVAAQDAFERQPPTRAENRTIERIVALEGEIEELMASLPPHLRDAVRERLVHEAEVRAAAEQAVAQAAAERAAAEALAARVAVGARVEAASGDDVVAPEPVLAPAVVPSEDTTRRKTSCTTLWSFDSDRNGRVDGLDRYWRYFFLWTDANGDGVMAEGETKSVYERGIQDVAVSLDGFVRRKKETAGDIAIGKHIVLDIAGDGFDGPRGTDDGALVIDASRMARGEGPALLADDDVPLEGLQPFRAGLRLRLPNGEVVALSCP